MCVVVVNICFGTVCIMTAMYTKRIMLSYCTVHTVCHEFAILFQEHRMAVDKKLQTIATKYWLERDTALNATILLREFGIFMKKTAKKLAKGAELVNDDADTNADKKVLIALAKFEWDMRSALSLSMKQKKSIGHGELPHPCLPEPVPEEDESRNDKAPSVLHPFACARWHSLTALISIVMRVTITVSPNTNVH